MNFFGREKEIEIRSCGESVSFRWKTRVLQLFPVVGALVKTSKTSRFFEKHPQKAKLARKCLPLSLEDM